METIISFGIMLLMATVFGALGGYFFKIAVSNVDNVIKVVFHPCLYIGGILYFGGAVLNIIVLTKFPYTVVLPATAITYIWTMLISYFLLKEKITKNKIFGVLLIIIGSLFIGLSMM